jgi:hypothetical protein
MAPKTMKTLPHSAAASRANRGRLTLLGLILLVGGLAGLAVSYGFIGKSQRHRPVLGAERVHLLTGHWWFWLIVAVVAGIVALAALGWLFRQFGSDRVADVQVEQDRRQGKTVLSAGAVTSAVADEVASYRGVDRARAHLRGAADAPVLVLSAVLDDDADIGAVRDQVIAGAVSHARQALDDPDLPARVEFRLGGHDNPGPR